MENQEAVKPLEMTIKRLQNGFLIAYSDDVSASEYCASNMEEMKSLLDSLLEYYQGEETPKRTRRRRR